MQEKQFRHLGLEERERMFGLRLKGLSLRNIADELQRDPGTISREFERNAKYEYLYLPCRAQVSGPGSNNWYGREKDICR